DSENTDGASFLLDLGTNGEMVLETVNGKTGKTERIACATAAGPCFEGAKISCGMCAETGAVTCIENRDGAFFCVTVQNAPIRGICGSALIDLTAELLRLGILTVDGRLLEPEEVVEALSAESEQKIPSEWATRVVKVAVSVENSTREDFSVGFQLAPGITVTQEDFRELQLAVGAIRTGIRILFRRGEVTVDDVAHFRIAGGFGRGIRMRNAQKIGLIPAEISEKKLEFVGNSSLSGAVLAAVSERFWTLARTVADTTRCLDLALDRDFSDVFMESMFWEEF
ncbi:MAG: ASKHA domain-containing protein, partial [Planctomycetia bacterium]|nr:ASKHA domain-containing protein [Planctomycetia bacterium]